MNTLKLIGLSPLSMALARWVLVGEGVHSSGLIEAQVRLLKRVTSAGRNNRERFASARRLYSGEGAPTVRAAERFLRSEWRVRWPERQRLHRQR
jgi:hypothetical protein